MVREKIVAIFVVLTVFGCAGTDDPRQGGFFGGLHGIISGSYQKRIDSRKEEVERQQENTEKLQEKSKSLEREQESQEIILANERQRVLQMKNDIERISKEVAQYKADSEQKKSKVSSIQNKIAELQVRVKSQQSAINKLDQDGGCTADPSRCQMLELERERLSMEFKRLLEYQKALSEATN